jgi:prepilin-type processing-associated H-X9-DG protein
MHSKGRGFTIVHLLVVLFLFVIGLAFMLPSVSRTRCGSTRVKCQSNLSQIGKALLLYSNENKGSFPRTIAVPGAPIFLTNHRVNDANPFSPDTTLTPGTTNNIPAAMFLLVRTQDMTTEVFACPEGTAEKDLMNNLAATLRGNFTGDPATGSVAKNVSYSFVNVYPSAAAIEKGYKTFITAYSSDFAIAADLSPAPPDDPRFQSIKAGAARAVMIKGNSRNHDQDGQNVLYADGHAEFQQTPLCGVNHDLIYTAQSGGVDPANAADSVLLISEK